MSRCFPYPPPGYSRNGVTYESLIESIKLQKETNKTRSERKKEKAKKEKKEKRQKEKRNVEGEFKLKTKAIGDSHKGLQKSTEYTEAQLKKTKAITELFEKSDLTEEHGQHISPHQPSYSSDSTQNSNKRKRDDSTDHGKGKPVKIRFLKKHRESDSTNFGADSSSNTHSLVSSSFNSDRSLISSIRTNGVPATSGRENRPQMNSNGNFERTKINDPNSPHFGRIQSVPSSAKPIIKSNRPQQQPVSSFGRQVLPSIHSEHEMPSLSDVSRHVDEQELYSCRQHGMFNPVLNKTTPQSAAGNEGVASLKKQKEDPQKVGPTRHEKKMLKKHAKYEKLIGSWLPPVFQAHLPDVGDDGDWLSMSKTSNASVCKGEDETCRQLVAPWQPCARYLAEVDVHALPYTVPF